MSYQADAGNYLETQVYTASRTQLIQLLFERAIRDLSQALELVNTPDAFLELRSWPESIRLVVHAQKIISELQGCLNPSRGGEITVNLARLYEFMLFKTTESVEKRDKQGLIEVRDMLGELLDGWRTVVASEQETVYSKGLAEEVGCLVA